MGEILLTQAINFANAPQNVKTQLFLPQESHQTHYH